MAPPLDHRNDRPMSAHHRRIVMVLVTCVALALGLGACSTGAAATSGVDATVAPTSPAMASPATAVPSTDAAPSNPASTPCPSTRTTLAELGALARNGPDSGVWVGMNLDWASQSVSDVSAALGAPPATVVSFVSFPMTADDTTNLTAAATQAADAGSVLIVTLEPWGGLASATEAATTDLAEMLAAFGAEGVPTIVRFAHEMNGSWYPWSQDPAAYVAAFRRVADVVHATAPTAGMLWAPNQGEGYPYKGGKYGAAPGSSAAQALDTDGNGRLGSRDDPYAPYWPGASYVDWVGMSLYHWGDTYPWGANVVPAPDKFSQLITGTSGSGSTPDFYSGYAERYGKPLAIVETAAFFRPGGGGATARAIKGAWLGQIFSAGTKAAFPLLRIVNWFEWQKFETEVDAVVDWRIAAAPTTRHEFLAAMTDGFHLGPAVPTASVDGSCTAP